MSQNENSRRGFLQAAGVAVAALSGASKFGAGTPETAAPTQSQLVFDVRQFGAKGDGKSVDTPAINRAIESAANAGGGTVVFPAGIYLSYSIRLKSKVALALGMGCTILAADPPSQNKPEGYDMAESNQPWEAYQDFGHNHWHNSLIWGENLEDLAIQGPGLIWGKRFEPRRGTWPCSGDAGRCQQGHRSEELPQHSSARFLNSSRWTLRYPRDRSLEPHHRQPEDRHATRWHRRGLLSQRAHFQLHSEFTLGRRHLSEEFVRARVCVRYRDGNDQRLHDQWELPRGCRAGCLVQAIPVHF